MSETLVLLPFGSGEFLALEPAELAQARDTAREIGDRDEGITNPCVVLKPLNNLSYFWPCYHAATTMRYAQGVACAAVLEGQTMTSPQTIGHRHHRGPSRLPWSAEPRTERHTARIKLYKEAMKEGRVPPPIVVCEVDGGARILLDGRHRLTAYAELGRAAIPAALQRVPTAADAIRLAFQALGPVNFCQGACEEFLRQEERQAGTSPRGKGKA